jgi:hypothetical protein
MDRDEVSSQRIFSARFANVVLDGIPFGRTAEVTELSCRRQDD